MGGGTALSAATCEVWHEIGGGAATNAASHKAKIPNMSPNQSESIDFYIEPLICGTIPVFPMVTYIDAYGEPHMTPGKKVDVVSKCPLIFNPGEKNIAKVKHLFESKEIIKSFRSFELKHDSRTSFDLLREAIRSWAGKPASKPNIHQNNPFHADVYYYISNQNEDPNLDHKERIIIRLSVSEKKNIAKIDIGAETNPTVSGIMTHIWEIINKKFREVYGYKLKSLRCIECGAPLRNIVENKNYIKCKYCGSQFEKKALL